MVPFWYSFQLLCLVGTLISLIHTPLLAETTTSDKEKEKRIFFGAVPLSRENLF